MRLPIESAHKIRRAKFPEGKKMTVDEVAEVVGPEFKEMNEDPPESVKKVREDMEESMSADLLPVERAASEQQAEKLEAEAEANEAQADADRQKADAARMKESRRRSAKFPKGQKMTVEEVAEYFRAAGNDKAADEWLAMHEKNKDVIKDKAKKQARDLLPIERRFAREDEGKMSESEKKKFLEENPALAKNVEDPPKEVEALKEKMKGKKARLRRAARRYFAGRRYDYDEVIDFLTEDKSTPELERMWKKWSKMVEDLHDRWFEGWAEANAPELLDESIDYKELAWKAFGSVTDMGVGLWEGDFLGDEHDEAFEKVVDSKIGRFGQDLYDETMIVREGGDEESMRMASRRKMLRKAFVPDSVDGWLEWEDGTRTAADKMANPLPKAIFREFRETWAAEHDSPFAGRIKIKWTGSEEEGTIRFFEVWSGPDMLGTGEADEWGRHVNISLKPSRRAASRKTAMTPYEKNQKAMLAEAGDSLKRMYDPFKLAQAIVKMRSFKKMVGSSVDMVKDALIALEEGGAIRRLDDDLFFEMRDEAERLMFPQRRASTRRRG
jgi:hypothetical protein